MVYKQHGTTLKKCYLWTLFWGSHVKVKYIYTLYNLTTLVFFHSIMDAVYFSDKILYLIIWWTSLKTTFIFGGEHLMEICLCVHAFSIETVLF